MAEEIWKDIEGYEGSYQVSNFGRVKSMMNSKRGRKLAKDCILSPTYTGIMKYPAVLLYRNGRKRTSSVHRLVAQAFIPNPMHFPIVNHKDENPQNNHVDNLEWCTQEYNCNLKYPNKKRARRIWKKWKRRFGTTLNKAMYFPEVEIESNYDGQCVSVNVKPIKND